MKRNIHKNLLGMLKSKSILAVASGLLLMSCGAQMGGYSETDGVYYDPNKDTLPEGVIINGNEGNRVGEYYDYYQDDSNLVQNAQINAAQQDNRYSNWNNSNWNGNASDSDWGNFAGNETNYYDNSWGMTLCIAHFQSRARFLRQINKSVSSVRTCDKTIETGT